VFKQAALQPDEAMGQTLNPELEAGAKYNIAVFHP
jgi:hypothetical protein